MWKNSCTMSVCIVCWDFCGIINSIGKEMNMGTKWINKDHGDLQKTFRVNIKIALIFVSITSIRINEFVSRKCLFEKSDWFMYSVKTTTHIAGNKFLSSTILNLLMHDIPIWSDTLYKSILKCVWLFWDNMHWRVNPLSANPTKWSNTLSQFVGCCWRIIWVSVLWGWRLKG